MRGASSPLLAAAEQGNGFIDPTLPGVGTLGGGDVVDVIPLHAIGELAEECAGLLVGRERGGEVGGKRYLPRVSATVRVTRMGSPPFSPVGPTDGGADAEHVLTAHHADRAPLFVSVDVDEHCRAFSG